VTSQKEIRQIKKKTRIVWKQRALFIWELILTRENAAIYLLTYLDDATKEFHQN
jgi:hypothetical protein